MIQGMLLQSSPIDQSIQVWLGQVLSPLRRDTANIVHKEWIIKPSEDLTIIEISFIGSSEMLNESPPRRRSYPRPFSFPQASDEKVGVNRDLEDPGYIRGMVWQIP